MIRLNLLIQPHQPLGNSLIQLQKIIQGSILPNLRFFLDSLLLGEDNPIQALYAGIALLQELKTGIGLKVHGLRQKAYRAVYPLHADEQPSDGLHLHLLPSTVLLEGMVVFGQLVEVLDRVYGLLSVVGDFPPQKIYLRF